MQIETKYSIGDKVYTVEHRFVQEEQPCHWCSMVGHLYTAEGAARTCDQCHGAGVLRRQKTLREAQGPFRVVRVQTDHAATTQTGKGLTVIVDARIGYNLEDVNPCYSEKNVYATLEEAEAAAREQEAAADGT